MGHADAIDAGATAGARPSWAQAMIDHVGWLIPVALAMGTMFRLAAVSRGDPTTAVAILRYSGTASVLTSTAVLAVFPAIAIAGLVGQLYLDPRGRRVPLSVLLVPVFVNLQLASVFVLAMTVVSTVIALVHGYATPRLRELVRRPIVPFFGHQVQAATAVSAVLILLALTLLLLVDAMWLPTEQVEIAKDDELVGFVLGRDGDQTVVLRQEDRLVLYVQTDRIDRRTICRVGPTSSLQVPLPVLVGLVDRPRYPRCPAG